MGAASAVAECLRYPGPERLEALEEALATVEEHDVRRSLERFVASVGRLALSQWEELHTHTLDLSPLFVPYVGHVVWGENYRRGAFMADLARELAAAGVATEGELPDHLMPVLRYLDTVPAPLGDLIEVLPQALARMRRDLADAEKSNPYLHVLDAAAAATAHMAEAARRVSR